MSTTEGTPSVSYHGRVKWFNNKAGYGFITVIDGPVVNNMVGTDIFVHHTSICVSQEQYRYLVQGEYVEFSISKIESETDSSLSGHKYQSTNIKGVNGGKLMCETRNDNRVNINNGYQKRTLSRSRNNGSIRREVQTSRADNSRRSQQSNQAIEAQ